MILKNIRYFKILIQVRSLPNIKEMSIEEEVSHQDLEVINTKKIYIRQKNIMKATIGIVVNPQSNQESV
jgi:hypothetical protein